MFRLIAGFAALAMAFAMPAKAVQTTSTQFVMVTSQGAGLYSFLQSGFANGATVTGNFTAFDLDNDNQLSSFTDEISDFSAAFSGGGGVPVLNFIDGLVVFDLDGSGLLGDGLGETSPGNFDGESEGIVGFSFDFSGAVYIAGPGPFFGITCGNGETCAVVQAAIPEPASWALLIAGFGLTGATLRYRRAIAA